MGGRERELEVVGRQGGSVREVVRGGWEGGGHRFLPGTSRGAQDNCIVKGLIIIVL